MNKYCNVILKQHYSVILTKNNDYFLAKYKTENVFIRMVVMLKQTKLKSHRVA